MSKVKLTNSVCQCSSCKEYFSTTHNFDLHRGWALKDGKVDIGTNRRQVCLNPLEVGLLQRENGVWAGPSMTKEQKEKLYGKK